MQCQEEIADSVLYFYMKPKRDSFFHFLDFCIDKFLPFTVNW